MSQLFFVSKFVYVLALALGGAVDALATEDPDATQEEEELQVYEKHNLLLHGSKKAKYVK